MRKPELLKSSVELRQERERREAELDAYCQGAVETVHNDDYRTRIKKEAKSDFLALIEDRLANLEATDPTAKGNAYIAGQRDALTGLRDALNGWREPKDA